MAAMTDTPDVDLGPIIALRSLMRTVWRQRRVWLLTALLGVIVGASLHLVLPHKYSATTDIYLAQPVGSDPLQAMQNDVSLLHTEAVAGQAVSANHLGITPNSLLSHYSGLALSNDILSIKYNGTTKSNAVAGARDVARAFLLVQAKELSLQTDVLVRGLRSQVAALNAAVEGLNSQRNALATTAPSPQVSDKLTELVSESSADASQITQLQSQIQQALANQQSADRVSHVLDPAAIAQVSVKRVTIMDALSGLVIGLAVGLAYVIFRALLVERPLDRATVAATLGTPVELSLGRYKSPRLMRRRRLRRRLRRPSPALHILQGRLRGHVESAPGSSLAVVAAGTAEPAALAVGALALALSADGHEVVVVDAADERPLASLLGLTATPRTMDTFQSPRVAGPRVRVFVVPDDPAQMAQKAPPDDADAVLVLATLDPAFGADHLASWVTDAVMVLRPKGFPYTRLTAYREMLRTAGVSLRALFLLGADSEDDSSGALAAVDARLTTAGAPVPST